MLAGAAAGAVHEGSSHVGTRLAAAWVAAAGGGHSLALCAEGTAAGAVDKAADTVYMAAVEGTGGPIGSWLLTGSSKCCLRD
jgi:hypothetical protein